MERTQNPAPGVLSQALQVLTGCAGWPDLRAALPGQLRASTIGGLESGFKEAAISCRHVQQRHYSLSILVDLPKLWGPTPFPWLGRLSDPRTKQVSHCGVVGLCETDTNEGIYGSCIPQYCFSVLLL